MGLLLTCLQAARDQWILLKYRAFKYSVHAKQISTDLQKARFPGMHLYGPPCQIETYSDFYYYCECESSPPSVFCFISFSLHSIDGFLSCGDSLLQDVLCEVLRWLETHPQEVVILACRNFDGLTRRLHCHLTACIKEIFQCKLCPRNVSMTLFFQLCFFKSDILC